MQTVVYKLVEYKIVENFYGDLSWECHVGFGSLKNGKCFINGDILYLKPSDIISQGFLRGEFLDHLNRLPKWQKTKYYCTSYQIRECKSGKIKLLLEKNDTISRKKESNQSVITDNNFKSVEQL